jgi:tetratricopeptide (TPR) repeat protein
MDKSFWIKCFIVFFTLTVTVGGRIEAQAHNADYYYERSNRKIHQGNLGGAIEDINTAIKLKPNDSRNYNARGLVYEKSGNYESAMADFKQAFMLNPHSAETLHNIRNLSNKIKNSEKHSSGINYAFDAVTQSENSGGIPVENQTPAYTAELSASNQAEISQTNQDASLQTSQEASLQTNQEASLPNQNNFYNTSPPHVDIIDDVQDASLPNQNNFYNTSPPHVSIIDDVQVPTHNAPIYSTPTYNAPTYSTPRYSTPMYNAPAGFPENAASSTDDSPGQVKAYPVNYYAAYGTGEAVAKSDSRAYTPVKTVGYTTAKYKRSPEPPIKKIFIDPAAEKYNILGVELNEKGHFDEAIEQFNAAINIYPNYAVAYNNRGAAFACKGDPKRALEDFNQALRINPYYHDAQFNRERVMND